MAPRCNASNLNRVLKDMNNRYVGVDVAWTDNARGVSNSALSCFGKNITDQRLVSKHGDTLPFARTQNFDETLGVISPDRVVCGDFTFKDVWEHLEDHLAYSNYKICRKNAPTTIAMRFQTAFVPVTNGETHSIAPANFSYQTSDPNNPRNLLIVVTPTGLYAHTDGVGYKKLMAHTEGVDTKIKESWFEAQQTDFTTGSTQVEAESSRLTRSIPHNEKRAKISKLGIDTSGPRCNRMLIFSIPLKQTDNVNHRGVGDVEVNGDEDGFRSLGGGGGGGPIYRSMGAVDVHEAKCRAARLNVGGEIGDAVMLDLIMKLSLSV